MYIVGVVFLVSSVYHVASLEDNKVVFPCTTPDNEDAFCTSLFSCPGLIKQLATLEPSALKYVKLSICLGCKAGDFMVCCGQKDLKATLEHSDGKDSSVEISPSRLSEPLQSKRENIIKTLIPDKRFCGYQHTDDRFYNETETAIDEFPWLVHIKFTDILSEYKVGDRCTGVLLNNRYVLTDTLCAGPAKKVRLGQYDAAYKVKCVQNPAAHECTEGTIEVRIDKKINLQKGVFELYSLTLIRLADRVQYSDFVRPICLPLIEDARAGSEKPLTFSGWGAKRNATVIDDAIKKRLVYDMVRMDECTKVREDIENYINDKNKPSDLRLNCFAPKRTNTDSACPGDHGGPLMYSDNRHQWYVEQVVVQVAAFAHYGDCGQWNPIVAVQLTPEIINAILDNIEP